MSRRFLFLSSVLSFAGKNEVMWILMQAKARDKARRERLCKLLEKLCYLFVRVRYAKIEKERKSSYSLIAQG